MTVPSALRPPFTHDTALAKVQAAEDAWNSRDPERVSLAYTADSEWRNRTAMWEFDDSGLMARRYASINDAAIGEDERHVHVTGTSPTTPGGSR